jgi:hypothetical protein
MKEEHWVKQYWRPAIAWQYFTVCLFDFMIGPSLNYLYFYMSSNPTFVAWEPLTLNLSGFYHISMGAILGIAAYTRGQEKVAKIETSYEEQENIGEK